VADVRDGACSSSTLQEAWEQMVFAEATTVVPLIASDARRRGSHKNRKKPRWADLFLKA
jgi:deoxyhypusine synthase